MRLRPARFLTLTLSALLAPLAVARDAPAAWPPPANATRAELADPANWPNDPSYAGQWEHWSWIPPEAQALPGFRTEELAIGSGSNTDAAWGLTIGDPRVLIVAESLGLVFVTEEEVFGRRAHRASPRKQSARAALEDLRALAPGDYVVHVEHGIGRYLGLENKRVGTGASVDLLVVEYRGGAPVRASAVGTVGSTTSTRSPVVHTAFDASGRPTEGRDSEGGFRVEYLGDGRTKIVRLNRAGVDFTPGVADSM
jgi:hypothetical protein